MICFKHEYIHNSTTYQYLFNIERINGFEFKCIKCGKIKTVKTDGYKFTREKGEVL